MVWEAIQKWHQENPNDTKLLFNLFEIPFALAAFIPIGIGLLVLFGRCRVEWKEDKLRAAEVIGPFWWSRRMPQKPIRKLAVGAASSDDGHSPPKQLERFSALSIEFEDGSKKLLAIGYPKDWLLEVANELKTYIGTNTFSAGAKPVEVVDQLPLDENAEAMMQQPPASQVQVEELLNGIRLTVPPAGLWHGSKGMFVFALIWCAFITFFTVMMFKSGPNGDYLIPLIIMALFWVVGIGMLAVAINLGKRTAVLTAEGGRLRIETKSLFGVKQKEWSPSEIAAIRADNSGMEVNDRPVLNLQIHPRIGKKTGFLTGRDEAELRWIATRLRHALNVPARSQPEFHQ